jgi:RNA polymerase sigma-70 factor, ECF subfamily
MDSKEHMAAKSRKSIDKQVELAALFQAGLDGDSASYQYFLRQLTPLLRRVVSRKLPPSDVEDVVQDILISIHKARHTFDGHRSLMPWLMAIAGFRITDALRKVYAESRRKDRYIDEFAKLSAEVTEAHDGNESIVEILKGVPEREQRILTLMHIEGYTAKETGVRLGMKESAVKVAAHRAIKKITEKMGT